MPQWSAMAKPTTNRSFQLVFDPGTEDEARIAFTISEADIDDAIDYGRVERGEPFESQIEGAAYHMVMNQRVCADERIFERGWVVLHGGAIIARNHMAASITEDELG